MEQIRRKIYEIEKDIKCKYLTMKRSKTDEDATIRRLFQPITEHLQQLSEPLQQIAASATTVAVPGYTSPILEPSIQLQEPSPPKESRYFEETKFLPLEDVTEEEVTGEDDGYIYDDSIFIDGPPNLLHVPLEEFRSEIRRLSTSQSMYDYLDQYPKIARPYIVDGILEEDRIDIGYGPKYSIVNSQWFIGVKTLNFESTGDIRVGDQIFSGTKGLYNLLFLKDPVKYTEHDLKNYKEILSVAKPQGQVKGALSTKYMQIIRPMFKSLNPRLSLSSEYYKMF